jgi:hypothetical protein
LIRVRRSLFTVGATAAAFTALAGVALASTTVSTSGNWKGSGLIAANSSCHCLHMTAWETNLVGPGNYYVRDNDSGVVVASGSAVNGDLGGPITRTLNGLYGPHYYIYGTGSSFVGSLSN